MTPYQQEIENARNLLLSAHPLPEKNTEVVVAEKEYNFTEKSFEQTEVKQFSTSEPSNIILPVGTVRRSSEPDFGVGGYAGANTVLDIEYGRQWLGLLEYLSVFNRHVSKAIENVVTMAATKHQIYFSDNIPKGQQKKMLEYLNGKKDSYYEFTGGETSLIQDLFTQACIHGVNSIEIIPHKKLSLGVEKVVRVSPKRVYFRYLQDDDKYIAVQSPKHSVVNSRTSDGYIVLNPTTYKYIAKQRINDSPYGVPPFLAAVEDIMLQKDMLINFKAMMKKVGMLGFLSVLVNKPKQLPNEKDDVYYDRLYSFLRTNVEPLVQGQISSGVAIGFKDNHEFNLTGTTMNAAVAKDLMQIVDTLIFEGLKQDPNLHGQNYSTTETFGNVILALMSQQSVNFQRIVGKSLEEIYMLDLILAGYSPGTLTVEFEQPNLKDRLKEAQAEQIQIANVDMKIKMGMIDQQTGAQELGYDKPALPEPKPIPGQEVKAEDAPADKKATKKDAKKGADSNALIEAYLQNLGAMADEYQYNVPDACGTPHKRINYAMNFIADEKLEHFANDYFNQVDKNFKKAVSNVSQIIQDEVEAREGGSREDLESIVLYHVVRNWQNFFKDSNKQIIDKNIEKVYQYYRLDKTIFGKKSTTQNSFDDIPDGMLNPTDIRVMNYLESSDDFYMGKFVTDQDTRNRIKSFVTNFFLMEGNPLSSRNLITKFIQQFTDFMGMESWKIKRIVETTLNKARNYANIIYLNQVGIERYEIVEVNDNLTCAWCSHMDGKSFEVSAGVELISQITNNPVQDVPRITPFATSVGIDTFKKLSSAQLLSMNIISPPFHANCRGRLVMAD